MEGEYTVLQLWTWQDICNIIFWEKMHEGLENESRVDLTPASPGTDHQSHCRLFVKGQTKKHIKMAVFEHPLSVHTDAALKRGSVHLKSHEARRAFFLRLLAAPHLCPKSSPYGSVHL